MDYKQTREFTEDLALLLKKHNLSVVTGPIYELEKIGNSLNGRYFFVTDGSNSIHLQGGEKMQYEASTVIHIQKNRYKQ